MTDRLRVYTQNPYIVSCSIANAFSVSIRRQLHTPHSFPYDVQVHITTNMYSIVHLCTDMACIQSCTLGVCASVCVDIMLRHKWSIECYFPGGVRV